MKLSIIELFAGIGAQRKALDNLGIEVETVGISEIDKYAIQSYMAIHGQTKNYGDITKIESLDYADLWTYSFPCQDLSVAGKQQGIKEGTRSGLLLEVQRLLEKAKSNRSLPKYLLLENVKNLVGKKFKPDFLKWLNWLDDLGYRNYWQVLNSKNYGIPQNRERVFVISIRKDIQLVPKNLVRQTLKYKLKDMLEPQVDEIYYLSNDKVAKFLNSNFHQERDRLQEKDYCDTLLARDYKDPKLVKEVSNSIRCSGRQTLDNKHTWDIVYEPLAYDEQNDYIRKDGCVGTIMTDGSSPKHNNRVIEPLCAASRGRNPDNPSDRSIGSPTEQRLEINYSGCTNTLTSVQKDNYVIEPLQIKEATQKGYAEAYGYDSVSLDQPNSKTRRGRVGKQISNTLTCSCNMGVVEPKIIHVAQIYPNSGNPQAGRVYDGNGISPAMDTCSGGNRMPKILEGFRDEAYDPFLDELEDEEYEDLLSLENRVDPEEIGYRIRKLTPRECWRLMGFTDHDFDCAKSSGVSNSQLYKQAGNSIVVNVLMAVFKSVFLQET